MRKVWAAGRGITYERIDQSGLQWPCPTEAHPGTTMLHAENFPLGKHAALRRIEYRPTSETVSEEYPFLLVTGRALYHFNAGTMTLRTKNRELRAEDLLEISLVDAKRLKLADGDRVRVKSRYGEAMLPARINSSVKPGELFIMLGEIAAWVARENARVKAAMDAAFAKLKAAGLKATVVLKDEEPRRLLVYEAESWGADAIFLGSKGMGPIERFLIGSVSSAIAARAHCSVEVVRAVTQ